MTSIVQKKKSLRRLRQAQILRSIQSRGLSRFMVLILMRMPRSDCLTSHLMVDLPKRDIRSSRTRTRNDAIDEKVSRSSPLARL